MNQAVIDQKAVDNAVGHFIEQVDQQRDAIMKIAPGMSWDSFRAATVTAVTRKPEVLKNDIDRNSVFLACQDAAHAGLLPDGKEGAIIVRWNNSRKRNEAVFQAMIAGMRKVAYRTKRIVSMQAHIVYEGEDFRIQLGDEESIHHVRDLDAADAGLDAMRAAYCVVTMEDGTKIRRHMTAKRIKSVRDACKSWDGPWGKKQGSKESPVWITWGSFADEMVVKTILLFTLKAVDLSSAEMQQFATLVDRQRDIEAMDSDLQASGAEPPAKPAQITSEQHLDALEAAMKPREAVASSAGEVVLPPADTAPPPADAPSTHKLVDKRAAKAGLDIDAETQALWDMISECGDFATIVRLETDLGDRFTALDKASPEAGARVRAFLAKEVAAHAPQPNDDQGPTREAPFDLVRAEQIRFNINDIIKKGRRGVRTADLVAKMRQQAKQNFEDLMEFYPDVWKALDAELVAACQEKAA